MENIYNEIVPSRIDFDNDTDKEYPTHQIITFHSLSEPKLGQIVSAIRNRIIYCAKTSIKPEIVLHFCFDSKVDSIESSKYLGKFISLAEYISSLKVDMGENISFTIMVRNQAPGVIFPLFFIGIDCIYTKLTSFGSIPSSIFSAIDYDKFNLPAEPKGSINKEYLVEHKMITSKT